MPDEPHIRFVSRLGRQAFLILVLLGILIPCSLEARIIIETDDLLFRSAVITTLNLMNEIDDCNGATSLSAIAKTLEKSPLDIRIRLTPKDVDYLARFSPDNEEDYLNHRPTSCGIEMIYGGEYDNFMPTLVHELAHADHAIRGKADNEEWGNYTKDEIYAKRIENLFRRNRNCAISRKYAGMSLPKDAQEDCQPPPRCAPWETCVGPTDYGDDHGFYCLPDGFEEVFGGDNPKEGCAVHPTCFQGCSVRASYQRCYVSENPKQGWTWPWYCPCWFGICKDRDPNFPEGYSCTDLLTDPDNCGKCGRACRQPEEICRKGACIRLNKGCT